jgi:hypothetical protein
MFTSPVRSTNPHTGYHRSVSKITTTPGSSAELIEKTINEFGEIINQRRTELSELKRANQQRLSEDINIKVISICIFALFCNIL